MHGRHLRHRPSPWARIQSSLAFSRSIGDRQKPGGWSSGKRQTDWEGDRIAIVCGRRFQHELIAALTEDEILAVSYSPWAHRSIGMTGVHVIGQSIGKVYLRRELNTSASHRCRANLKVDMHGSNGIPARIDGHEPGFAPGVRHLIASQELLADRVEPRIFDI